jgi:hypothetical protein
MTAFLGPGKKLSRITIGSLEDLGYKVDYSKADAFTVDNLDSSCICTARRGLLRDTTSSTSGGGGDRPADFKSLVTTGQPHKRRLSAETHAKAVAAGQALLAKNKAAYEAAGGDAAVPNGFKYVGDKFVVVAVRDGDAIASVGVKAA